MSILVRAKAFCLFSIGAVCLAATLVVGGMLWPQTVAAAADENEAAQPGEFGREPPPPPRDGEERPGDSQRRRPPRFEDLDEDGNGVLSMEEAEEIPGMSARRFKYIDEDEDGSLSREELPPPPPPPHRQNGSGEGYGERGPRRGDGDEDHRGGRRPPEFSDGPLRGPEAHFDEMDTDGDEMLSKEEFMQFHAEHGPRGGHRGGPGGPSGYGEDRGRPRRGPGGPPEYGEDRGRPRRPGR
jgi:EF hand domain-containing protein